MFISFYVGGAVMKKVLDLYSGLGGFSEAFARSPNYEVMRIENNPLLAEVPHTEIMCVLEFRDNLREMIIRGYVPDPVEIVLISPPCLPFSLGFNAPQAVLSREGGFEDYQPDMSELHAGLEIVEMLKPRYWVVENVRGAIRHFEPILGKHIASIGQSNFLWGNLPPLPEFEIESGHRKTATGSSKLRHNIRSLIPFSVSSAIMRAIENQRSIFDYLEDNNWPLL